MKPTTQYTKSGRINIAYQVFGSGNIDLVYIPGWVSNIDLMWSCHELAEFLRELGTLARVILFDKRGTGLSDRVVELSTLEERMDDIRAVMDAVGSVKAVLFGHSEGGSVSALFAATYPNRTISLITFGIFAKRRFSDDYPWAPTDSERQRVYDMIEHKWGSGEMDLESLAPSKANDKAFMEWLANYFRSGASPSAAMVLTKMNTEVDIINILTSIKVPTLLMQRSNDIDVKIEEGRFIADRIENSKFVEFEGNDHLFWVGNTKEVLNEIKSFVLQNTVEKNYDQQLFTIVSARLVDPLSEISEINDSIEQFVSQYRGKNVLFDRQTFISTFDGPSKAVHCSMELLDHLGKKGTRLAITIHIREGAVNEAHLISSETRDFINSMLQVSKTNQILVTQTVKNLLSGAGLSFVPYKSVIESASGESFMLYLTEDQSTTESFSGNQLKQNYRNDSLLENVLQSIDSNLSDESFGVEKLCKDTGISERQLQRKLKAITNKSPNQLISSVRLHRAKELLLGHQNNISEIAYQTGFANPSYFSKCFKKEFGLSPTDLLHK